MLHEAPDDLEISRAQNNDKNALTNVIYKTSPYVCSLCSKWCRHQLEAQDIAQEALIRIANNLNSFNHSSNFFTWVYTVTYRTFLDYSKKEVRRNKIASITPIEDRDFAEDTTELDPNIEALSDGLQALESIHSEILILIDLKQMSYTEVAQMLNVPIGTVRSRVARARLNLRKILVEQGTFDETGAVKHTEDKP